MLTKNKSKYSSHLAEISGEPWLAEIKTHYQLNDITLLKTACEFAALHTSGMTTFYGQRSFEFCLEIAEILLDLKLDEESIVAAILSQVIKLTDSSPLVLQNQFNNNIIKLVSRLEEMTTFLALEKAIIQKQEQLDKIRKMLLALATDIRVVIIKLAERLCFMRGIKKIPKEERGRYGQEVLDIYAPLANRLGIGQLKWELEDFAFRYVNETAYKLIANHLAERRQDREKRITKLIDFLKKKLNDAAIEGTVTGRAKHIYSIYLKIKRKNEMFNDLSAIYDSTAVRILVADIESCYTALSLVHSIWQPLIEEFDDYIAHPKPNGYRSIHTTVIDEHGKHFEIQIRSHEMHDNAERGVAAHWIYKEKKEELPVEQLKILHLRQLLDWHLHLNHKQPDLSSHILHDTVYVITPKGEIIDLPKGATPLDFAYHIHTDLGHRCRGVKVNGNIVPLSYTLRTGDKIDIVTTVKTGPSRDWLNAELGYIKTSRARSKITHWFKQQAIAQDILLGKDIVEKEFAKHGIGRSISLSAIAKQFDLKNEDALYVSLGRGNVRIGQVLQAIQPKLLEKEKIIPNFIFSKEKKTYVSKNALRNGHDLLTRFAKCCKPIPHDPILGYITQGRGISVHKENCDHIKQFSDTSRLMPLDWEQDCHGMFATDLNIMAYSEPNILQEITSLFINEKITLINLQSTFNHQQHKVYIKMTLSIENKNQLEKILRRLQELPAILEVKRSS